MTMAKMTSKTSKTGVINVLQKPSSNLLATWYAEQVTKGNIIVSKKVVLACKRHLNDLDRAGTEKFPFVFDESLGHRPIQFIEKYCKPSKGNYKQLILQPWQHFVLGSLFGWVHMETRLRRFKEGLIFVGRKNGKTTLISGVSLYGVSKDNESGADIPLLANSMKQARLIFDEAKAMIKSSPKLKKRFRPLRDAIHFDKTFSKIEPQASDSEKLDGLNTHIGVFDEIHEYKTFKLINVVKNSRASRDQPLLIYITTAGYQLDGPLIEYYKQADDVLKGVITDERTFYYMAELDSEEEFEMPEMWGKANPNIGVSIKLQDMIEEWEKAKRIPSERNDFITKRFNKFVNNSEESFLDYETLKKNDKEVYLGDIAHIPCIGGFDLSDSEDFTSACLEFPLVDTGQVVVLSHSWVPYKKVIMENENIPYYELQEEGLLTIVHDEYIRKNLIFDWFVKQSERFNIEMITYDRAKATELVENLTGYGFDTKMVIQGHITLGPAVDDVKERFLDGNVIFNNNRLFRWYINNVKMVEDRNRNKLPTKIGRYRKIDGFAAFLNAHTEVMKKFVQPAGEGNIEFISINDL